MCVCVYFVSLCVGSCCVLHAAMSAGAQWDRGPLSLHVPSSPCVHMEGVFGGQAICVLLLHCRIHHLDTFNDPTGQVATSKLWCRTESELANRRVCQRRTHSEKSLSYGKQLNAFGVDQFQKDNNVFLLKMGAEGQAAGLAGRVMGLIGLVNETLQLILSMLISFLDVCI